MSNLPVYLFMAVIIDLFMGITVSAEEIIKDRKILKREAFLKEAVVQSRLKAKHDAKVRFGVPPKRPAPRTSQSGAVDLAARRVFINMYP